MNTQAVVPFRAEHEEIVGDLRKLADRIDAGEIPARTAYVVLKGAPGERITTSLCGERMNYSVLMGMLAYAQHMLYDEATRG